jgi:dTDP-4-dehydrorhamnose reductase
MKKILVIGGSGFVGNKFGLTLPADQIVKTYFKNKIIGGAYFNIHEGSLAEIIKNKNDYSHVLFLGGIFKFDKINANLEEATLLNVDRTKKLLSEAVDLALIPVFFSTESVFDGRAGFYSEGDSPNPIFNYAQQKIEVEDYIENKFEKYLIVRSAKVYGADACDNTLVTSWLNKLHKNENIFCANDNIFSPIYVDDIIVFVEKLIELGCVGIYHLASAKPMVRIEMLDYVAHRYQMFRCYTGEIQVQKLHSFAGAEGLPLNTSLNPEKVIKATGVYPLKFKKAVDLIVAKFLDVKGK